MLSACNSDIPPSKLFIQWNLIKLGPAPDWSDLTYGFALIRIVQLYIPYRPPH